MGTTVPISDSEKVKLRKELETELSAYVDNCFECYADDSRSLLSLLYLLKTLNAGKSHCSVAFNIRAYFLSEPILTETKVDMVDFKDKLFKD